MFCPKCGIKINENENFCPKCGAKVFDTKDNVKNSKISKTNTKRNLLYIIIPTFVILCIAITLISKTLINSSKIIGEWNLHSLVDAETGDELNDELGDEYDIADCCNLIIKSNHKLEMILMDDGEKKKVEGTWKKRKDGWRFTFDDKGNAISFSVMSKGSYLFMWSEYIEDKHPQNIIQNLVHTSRNDTPFEDEAQIIPVGTAPNSLVTMIMKFEKKQTDKKGEKVMANTSSNKNRDEPKPDYPTADYIFTHSDTEYLTTTDIQNLSSEELALARNEIIARHGRIFTNEKYQKYFEGKSWYKGTIPPEEFDSNYENELNEIEKANIELIKKQENTLLQSINANKYYASILLEYQQAEQNNFSGNSTQYPHVNKTLLQTGAGDTLYYSLIDLSDDGTPELFIAQSVNFDDNTYNIMDIYGFAEESAQHLVIGNDLGLVPLDKTGTMGNRVYYNICENNLIREVGSSGADVNNTGYYQLAANSITLKLTEGASQNGANYYKLSDGLETEEISKQEYTKLKDKYALREDLQWNKLSDFKSDNISATQYKVTQSSILGSDYETVNFNVRASSTLQEKGYNHDVSVLSDNDNSTCWSEGVDGNGIGEQITFSVSGMETTNALYIKPGYAKSKEAFYNNGCPTKLKIICGDLEGEADLSTFAYSEDSFLIIDFGKTFKVGECSVIIEDVREGQKYNNTCITEMYFLNLK